jgi:outer membrane protein assembly factor BamB
MTRDALRLTLAVGALALVGAPPASSALSTYGLAPGAVPTDTWFEFRDGFQNRGLSSVAARATTADRHGRTPWAFRTSGLVWGTPVIDTLGNVYVGSADKRFYALAPDGTLRWSATLPDVGDSLIDSAAALTPSGLVVVPGGDGALHAFDALTGAEKWTFASRYGDQQRGVLVGSFEGNVTVGPDGLLYAGCDDGHLYCVDAQGRERWSFATGMMIWSAPAFDPTARWLAFGSLDKRLYVLDRASGREIAHYTGGAEFKSSPAIDDEGRIYAGCSDGSLYALVLEGGARLVRRWSFATRGEVYSSPALADDRLVFGSQDGSVYAVSTSGELAWRYETGSRVSASPLVTRDGVVLVGAKNGRLYALDLATGKRLWSFKASRSSRQANLDSSPALDPSGRVLVGSYDGSIYGIPFEFAAQNPADPRVSLDPGDDRPDFGGPVPLDAAVLRPVDGEGALVAKVPALDPASRLTFRLVAMERGSYVPNAAICYDGLSVTVTPEVPVTVTVGTDRTCLDVEPRTFWEPGVSYALHVEGSYYHKGNPFLDLLKYFGLSSFKGDASFEVAPGPTALPRAPSGSVLRYSVRDLYLGQPEVLDTLIPAAVAGQAFIATVLVTNDAAGTLGLLALPAYPRPDGTVALRPDPERVFFLNGTFRGDAIEVSGRTALAAMGADIPFDPIRLSGRLTATGIEGGQVHATAPLLEIHGNGASYQGLSWSALFDLADPSLRLQAFGSLSGARLPAPAVPVLCSGTRWSGSDLEVTLDRAASAGDDHIMTALLIDEARGAIVEQASAKLPAGAAGRAEKLVLHGLDGARAAGGKVSLRLYFDGEPIPLRDARGP